jgi:hypothetical protein
MQHMKYVLRNCPLKMEIFLVISSIDTEEFPCKLFSNDVCSMMNLHEMDLCFTVFPMYLHNGYLHRIYYPKNVFKNLSISVFPGNTSSDVCCEESRCCKPVIRYGTILRFSTIRSFCDLGHPTPRE